MANFFQNLKAGAQDLVGGVTGQQTGEMIELEWVCEAPALGLRLRKSETPQFLCAERDDCAAGIFAPPEKQKQKDKTEEPSYAPHRSSSSVPPPPPP